MAKKVVAKKAPVKKAASKKPKKETFTVSVFTKRGAMSHIKIYEKAGYKLVGTEITEHQVFMTFEDK